jgi:uncharacterized SAM-binding protein YcdF (DUF218 family)
MLAWLELLTGPVALIAWGLLFLVWRSWRAAGPAGGRRVATALAVFYFGVTTPLGANLVVGALEAAAPPAARACLEPAPGSAIVVLAGGMSGEAASSDAVASLQVTSVRRVLEGQRLARATADARLILAGGSGEAVREADLMGSLATALGFPPERLLLERESRTTAEGAAHVARLLARQGGEVPAVHLVTSAMHMRRAAASFRRQGVEVCPVPVDRRWVRPAVHEALIPQITALDKSTAAYHEIAGYVVYWVTGRL